MTITHSVRVFPLVMGTFVVETMADQWNSMVGLVRVAGLKKKGDKTDENEKGDEANVERE